MQATTEAAPTSADVVLLVLFVALALGFSFLCSIAEAVLLSVTPSYIEQQKEKHPKRAVLLKKLKQDNVDQSLAAILTLNTIAHTLGAIGSGAKASIVFGSAWFGLFSAVMTLLILFASEIIPKTIGAVYWPRLVAPTTLFVRSLIIVLYPIVWVSEKLTKVISRGKEVHVFSRDEFLAMARLGVVSGHIEDKESRIIENLLQLNSIRVRDVMTPVSVVTAFEEGRTLEQVLRTVVDKPFSRFPIYHEKFDEVTGFVLKDEILLKHAQGQTDLPLKSLRREVLVLPFTVSVSVAFERLLRERQQIAVVFDEYGGFRGLVSLEDVIETLLGVEIVDESDTRIDMRELARKLWRERAKALGVDVETTADRDVT